MIENNNQNSRQAASTAFHNAPKLAKIAQAGIHGGSAGAAAEATVQYRKEVLVVVIAVLLLPVLVLLMLPGAIFGALTQPSTAVNDDLEIASNVIQLRNAVSDILQEGVILPADSGPSTVTRSPWMPRALPATSSTSDAGTQPTQKKCSPLTAAMRRRS